MSRNLNRGQRFDSGQHHHAPHNDHSLAIAAVKGLWPQDEAQEIVGSDFTSSASSSSACETRPESNNDRHEFEVSKPRSFGTSTYTQERALAAWEAYQKTLAVGVSRLNPHASAFVPTVVPHSAAPPTQHPQWSPTFIRGAQSSHDVHGALAHELINTFPWNLSEISQLAQHFSLMGMLGGPDLASFAASVKRALFSRVGGLAQAFEEHLQLCCHDAFMTFWDMASPSIHLVHG